METDNHSSLSNLYLNLMAQPTPDGGGNAGRGLRERLCTALRHAIASGQLPHGARLPASRVLASDLQLSRVTVEAAYAQLEAEGYLSRKVGRGTLVSIRMRGTALDAPALRAAANYTANNTAASAIQPEQSGNRLLSQRGARITLGGGCIDAQTIVPFAAGCPDLRAFPLETWRTLTNRRLRQGGSALLGYGDPQGYPPLRSAIANYLNQSRGVRCDAAQVLILTSSQQALQLLATLLLDDGDTVWVEEPGYRGAKTAFASVGARLQAVPVDQDGICIDALLAPGAAGVDAANATRADPPRLIYTTPSHQYPLGVTLSLARRLALIEYAQAQQAWLIEDDYDSAFQYDGHAMPAMQGLDRHDRVIYIGTFSKVLFPSLRLAYLVLPPPLVAAFCSARSIHDGHSSQLMQAVTYDFIHQGHFATHLRHMRQLYRARRDLLLEQLQQKLGHHLQAAPGHGGLQLVATLPGGDEAQLSRQAAQLGVQTPGLAALYLGQPQQSGWLLGYAGLRNDEIVAAVDQLARLWR
jgi:GntR family transcriptional regulator/MocR family aminotransferase